MLVKIKLALKEIPPIRKLWQAMQSLRQTLMTQKGNRVLSKWEKTKPDACPLSVGFIVQLPEIWDKQRAVFEQMLTDSRFDAYLIMVPAFDFANWKLPHTYGPELEYFKSLYPADRILYAANADGTWLDLQSRNFDYVFYQRPYEHYLPAQYSTENVVKYSRTAYIPYFYMDLRSADGYYDTPFFAYLYLFFCSSETQRRLAENRSRRRNVYLGYPALERIGEKARQDKTFTFLWTPRWVDDVRSGGSGFMKYKGKIVSWKAGRDDFRLIMRPHPLTFPNAIREGKMTETEVRDYKNKLAENHITLDRNALVEDTFVEMDALITDASSIIIAAFLTGKPIIFCANPNINLSEEYRMIVDASYQAGTWEKIVETAEMLLRGEDPLAAKRAEVLRKIKVEKGSAGRILERLLKG